MSDRPLPPANPIAVFNKNSTEKVYITVEEFRGKPLLNVRVWFLDRDTEMWCPGKQGFALPIEKYEPLMTGLNKAGEKIQQLLASKQ